MNCSVPYGDRRLGVRLEPITAFRIPDARHCVDPAVIVAEDGELERDGRTHVHLERCPPELETWTEALEGRGRNMRGGPKVGRDHQSANMRRAVVLYLEIDRQDSDSGSNRIRRVCDICNRKGSLHSA
jgi:hypothetical protein